MSEWSSDSSGDRKSFQMLYITWLSFSSVPCFAVVQLLTHVWLFATPWTAACQDPLSFTISWSLLRFMSVELVMPFSHLILCHPLSLFAFQLSQHQGLFQGVSSLLQVASFSISLFKEYSGLISFRINWSDLLAVQGTLTSFHQDHSAKSISSLTLSLLNHDSKYNLYLIKKTQEHSWSSRNVSQGSWGRCPIGGFLSFFWKKQDPCVKLHSHQKETVLVEGMEVHHSDLLSKEAAAVGNTVAGQPVEATLLNPLQLVKPHFPWAALLQGPGSTGLLEVGHSAWPGAPLKGNFRTPSAWSETFFELLPSTSYPILRLPR